MTIAIIPSRFGSTRFKGKPLALIDGKPLVQRVYEQAAKSESITRVVVATDDQKIFDMVKSFNAQAVMTSNNLRSGTDRVAQAADIMDIKADEIIVNIQGDQPVFNSKILDELVSPFEKDKKVEMATLACKIRDKSQVHDPKYVKVIFDKNHFAIYFSRAQIPFPRDKDTHVTYYKHLGFYAYKKSFLEKIAKFDSGEYENIEKLEQLRVLEAGHKSASLINVTAISAPP